MMWCGVLPRLWVAALMGTVAGAAAAAQVSIQASFAPSALEPTRNEFTNDTPNGGLCTRPGLCGPGEKSVLLPISVHYAEMRPFVGGDHQASITMPSAWRKVVLTHAETGRSAEAEWRASLASPKVSLAPVGGWSQWTRHGKAPARLQQELPFLLASSNKFSVKMRCQHDVSGRCGIANAATHEVVPIDVDVTMPGMREMRSGAFAQNTLLVSERSGQVAPRFTPQSYLQNRHSLLRFAANGPAMAQMLKAPQSRWQGDVTVVFDSEP